MMLRVPDWSCVCIWFCQFVRAYYNIWGFVASELSRAYTWSFNCRRRGLKVWWFIWSFWYVAHIFVWNRYTLTLYLQLLIIFFPKLIHTLVIFGIFGIFYEFPSECHRVLFLGHLLGAFSVRNVAWRYLIVKFEISIKKRKSFFCRKSVSQGAL